MTHRHLVLASVVVLAGPLALPAQSRTITPLCVGRCAKVVGLRLSPSDRHVEQVTGINLTLSGPRGSGTGGTLRGVSVGVLGTGAGTVEGIALSPVGIAASSSFRGIGISGIGAGVGGSAQGALVGLVGVGVGGSMRGIAVGGIGVGGGGSMQGISVGGIGAAVGGSMRGINVGGIGVGAGGSVHGLTVAGVGVGSGGSVRGLTVAGIGVASGGSVQGITVAGAGIASPSVRMVAVAPVIASSNAHGAMLAPGWLKIRDGEARGVMVSAFNDIRGDQRGLALGIVNYARSLKGVQVGAVNIVNDGRGPKVLPLINWR